MFKGEIFERMQLPNETTFAVVIEEDHVENFKIFYQQNNVDFDVIDEELGDYVYY